MYSHTLILVLFGFLAAAVTAAPAPHGWGHEDHSAPDHVRVVHHHHVKKVAYPVYHVEKVHVRVPVPVHHVEKIHVRVPYHIHHVEKVHVPINHGPVHHGNDYHGDNYHGPVHHEDSGYHYDAPAHHDDHYHGDHYHGHTGDSYKHGQKWW